MATGELNASSRDKLVALAASMVDQQRAKIVVQPNQPQAGFWFGGGNVIENPQGELYLVGRYRNAGDSRTGLGAGERGLQLAIFRSRDRGASFDKILELSKADLNVGTREVLSIEGSALHWTKDGVELYVSTEITNIGYPSPWESYLKPGTGVWTIERLEAKSVEQLETATPRTVVECRDPQFIHAKDPFVYDAPNGDTMLFLCTHPFNWSSSNTAYVVSRPNDEPLTNIDHRFFPRGFTWDVAISRGTCVVDVPRIGPFQNQSLSLMFYDGGESLRQLDEHSAAVTRTRGYSCEEIGGVACVARQQWNRIERLTPYKPLLVSPWGTGCSRYVDVHASNDGYFVTWQQSQNDLSQPLVMNFIGFDEVEKILG